MRWILSALAFIAGGCCAAQTLDVTSSPFSPASFSARAGTDIVTPIAAFRFAASGGAVDINAVSVELQGSGTWATDCSATDGLQMWMDDGDGVFNATDTQVFAGAPSGPYATASLTTPLTVASGATADLWVVIHILPTAGQSLPTTYLLSISKPSDVVLAAPATVNLGNPPPDSALLSIVVFNVTGFTPSEGGLWGSEIKILGSGFTPPVNAFIGGVRCIGVAKVNAQHTEVTGLRIACPQLLGTWPISISTGLLGSTQISQTYKSKDKEVNSCSTRDERGSWNGLLTFAALVACVLLAWRAGCRNGGAA